MTIKVTAEGQYVATINKIPTVKLYKEIFELPDNADSIGVARSVLQAGLVADRLGSKIDGFKRVRTCQVKDLEKTNAKAKKDKATELLVEATKLNCVPEGLEAYSDPAVRESVLEKAIARKKKQKDN
jgi:hypothetical protein